MGNMFVKRALAILGLLLFLAVLVLVPIALYADTLYRAAFGRQEEKAAPEAAYVTAFDLFAQETEHQTQSRVSGWLSMASSQEVKVSSQRGMLSATQYEPVGADVSAPWAIVFHGGLGTDRTQVIDVACMLSINGYRVLTPDLYAHGASDGDASTLGFGDAQDIYAWVDYAEKTQPGARIVLFGQDEGAAAVLTAACGTLSGSVAAVTADSACDNAVTRMLELSGAGENRLSAALLRPVFRRKTGNGAMKISGRISEAKTPLLLIHGTGDQTVPAWHSEDIALAAGENAQLLFIEGAGHGLSRYVQEKTYYDALLSFFEEALR